MRRLMILALVLLQTWAWQENWNDRNVYQTERGTSVFINFSEVNVFLTDQLGNSLNFSFGDGGIWGEGALKVFVYYNGSGNTSSELIFDFYQDACVSCTTKLFSAPILVEWFGKINSRSGFDKASFLKIDGSVFGESCFEGSCITDKLLIDDLENHSYRIEINKAIKYYVDGVLTYQRTGNIPQNVSLNFSDTSYRVRVRDPRSRTWLIKNQTKYFGGFDVWDVNFSEEIYSGSETVCSDFILVDLDSCMVNGTAVSGRHILSGCFEIYCYPDWNGTFVNLKRRVVEESDGEFMVFGEGSGGFSNSTHFLKLYNLSSGWHNLSLEGSDFEVYVDKLAPEVSVLGPSGVVLYGSCEGVNYGFTVSDDYILDFSSNFSTVVCEDFSFDYFAKDSVGNLVNETFSVKVGNVSQDTIYYFDTQTFWINKNVSLPIIWDAYVSVNFTGNFGADVLVSYWNTKGLVGFEGSGEREVVFEFSNESVGVVLDEGACNNYIFSRVIDKTVYLSPPEFNPKTHHISLDGIFNQTWWGTYSGINSSVSVCIEVGKQPGYLFCGDGVCTETCSSCPDDCGGCRSGGAGSGVSTVVVTPPGENVVMNFKVEVKNFSNISTKGPDIVFVGSKVNLSEVNYTTNIIELRVGFFWLEVIGKLLKNPFNYLWRIFLW